MDKNFGSDENQRRMRAANLLLGTTSLLISVWLLTLSAAALAQTQPPRRRPRYPPAGLSELPARLRATSRLRATAGILRGSPGSLSAVRRLHRSTYTMVST